MAQTEGRRAREKAVFIVDAARTPFLKARTGPGPFTASDLAVQAGRDLLARMPFDPPEIDHVVLGSTMPSPDEANIGRVAALRLGCGDSVPAYTVMRNCASGMQAVDSGANLIKLGQADLVLAGGADAMSHAPILWSPPMAKLLAGLMAAKSLPAKLKAVAALRPGHLKPVIALLRGLTDPVVGLNMGQTAEVLAERFGITREDMDEFAVRSHKRLAAAQQRGQLPGVTTLYPPGGRLVEHDDGVRLDSSVENLARLKPVFDREFGLVTAGNSSQITDGAAWVLLASEQAVKDHELEVLARIVDSQWAALDPRQMGLGPVHAVTPMLKRRRLNLAKVDYWEINEAFAAQVIACLRAFADSAYFREEFDARNALGEIDPERLNVDGGAIALGHPVGVSGARIVMHLAHVLRNHGAKRGVASICVGGGQGGAMLLEAA